MTIAAPELLPALGRKLSAVSTLTRWSRDELLILFTTTCGRAGEYGSWRLGKAAPRAPVIRPAGTLMGRTRT